MRSKSFMFQNESLLTTKSCVVATPGFKYDIGAKIVDFNAGQTAEITVERSVDGYNWVELARFQLDDGADVVANQVYVEGMAVRARVLNKANNPSVSVWVSEVD